MRSVSRLLLVLLGLGIPVMSATANEPVEQQETEEVGPISRLELQAASVSEAAGQLDAASMQDMPKTLSVDEEVLWEYQTVWMRSTSAELRRHAEAWRALAANARAGSNGFEPDSARGRARIAEYEQKLAAELSALKRQALADVPRDPRLEAHDTIYTRSDQATGALRKLP